MSLHQTEPDGITVSELPLIDRRVIAAVAQVPFPSGTEYFAQLVPIAFEDGSNVRPDDFPPHGRIWWKLGRNDEELAIPGKLLCVTLKRSMKAGEADNDLYEAREHTVDPIESAGLLEILEFERASLPDLGCLTDDAWELHVDHPAASDVWILWCDQIIGPLRAVSRERNDGECRLQLNVGSVPPRCMSVHDASPKLKSMLTRRTANVSLTNRSTLKGGNPHECRYRIIQRGLIDGDITRAGKDIQLETDAEFVRRVAKQLVGRRVFSKQKYRDFRELLDEFERSLRTAALEPEIDPDACVQRIRRVIEQRDDHATLLRDALVEAGFLDSQIARAVEEAVAKRRDEIQQLAQGQSSEVWERLNAIHEEESQQRSILEQKRKNAEGEIAALKQVASEELSSERARIEVARSEIETLRESVKQQLEPLVARMAEARSEVVAQFLTLAPLLESVGAIPGLEPRPLTSRVSSCDRQHESQKAATENEGRRFTQSTEFVKTCLWPTLKSWYPNCTQRDSELLHLALLGCRCILVPDSGWATAYAEALGGELAIAHVEPDWLSFDRALQPQVSAVWSRHARSVSEPTLILFEGVNRSPSSAWLQPFLSCLRGLTSELPTLGTWPNSIRLLFTFVDEPGVFTRDRSVQYAFGGISREHISTDDEPPGAPVKGFITAEAWESWSQHNSNTRESADLEIESLTALRNSGWYRCCGSDVSRLTQLLVTSGCSVETAQRTAKNIRLTWPAKYFEADRDSL